MRYLCVPYFQLESSSHILENTYYSISNYHILSYQILLSMEYYITAVLAKFIQHFSAVPYFSNFPIFKIMHLKLRTDPPTILHTFTGSHPSGWASPIYIFTTCKKTNIEVKNIHFYFIFYFLQISKN